MKLLLSLGKHNGKIRPPLITAREMAAELGLTLHQFGYYMGHCKNAPKPKFKRQKNTWYDRLEVMAWWKLHV